MNNAYWKDFYQNTARQEPSPFCYWCLKNGLITPADSVLDFASGSGQDTIVFNNVCTRVVYIEPNNEIDGIGCNDIRAIKFPASVVYACWALHAIDPITEAYLLDYAEKHQAMLLAEFRTTRDNPDDGSHLRRLIDLPVFIRQLLDRGFYIKRLEEGRVSPFKGKNAYVARIAAKYEGRQADCF